MSYGITPKMRQCLDFIRAYQADHGYPPNYVEIAAGIGLSTKSKSAVNRLLISLEERGRIKRISGCARSISLVPDKAEARP